LTSTFSAAEMARNCGYPLLGLSHGAPSRRTVTMAHRTTNDLFVAVGIADIYS
jgi:hypothetical protein